MLMTVVHQLHKHNHGNLKKYLFILGTKCRLILITYENQKALLFSQHTFYPAFCFETLVTLNIDNCGFDIP